MRRLGPVLLMAVMFASLVAPATGHAALPTVNSFMIKNGNTHTNDVSVGLQNNVANATEMQFSVDASATWSDWGPYAETTTVVLPTGDGEKAVLAHFRDDVDVTEASDSIILDTVTPHATLHLDSQPNLAGWYKKAPVYWFTAEEPVVVFHWWFTPPPFLSFQPGVTETSPTAPVGVNTLTYYAQDFAANHEDQITSPLIKVDETSPTVSPVGVPAGWTKSSVTVDFEAQDTGGSDLASVQSKLDEAAPVIGTQLMVSDEGNHSVEYWALDNADNESLHGTASVKIDKTSPTVSPVSVPAGWTNASVTVDFDAQDSGGSALASVQSRLDGAAPVAGVQRTISTEGNHSVEYWALDNATNESLHGTASVKIDKTSPSTSANALTSYDRQATVVFSPSDSLSGVVKTEWRVDGGTWNTGTVASIATLGTHNLEFRSTDAVGNIEAAKSATMRVYSASALTFAPLNATPKYAGETTFVARLIDASGQPVADQKLSFERWNGTAWLQFGVKTDANGNAYLKSQNLTTSRTYVVRYGGDDKYLEASPVLATAKPKVRLSRSTSWKTLKKGKAYYAKGYIEPKHAKSDANKVLVRLYKKGADKKYRYVKSFKAGYSTYSSTKSRYSAKVVIKTKGTYKLVAFHRADAVNADTWGSTDYFTVK